MSRAIEIVVPTTGCLGGCDLRSEAQVVLPAPGAISWVQTGPVREGSACNFLRLRQLDSEQTLRAEVGHFAVAAAPDAAHRPTIGGRQLQWRVFSASYGFGSFERMNSAICSMASRDSGSPRIWNTWTMPGQTSNFTETPSERAFFANRTLSSRSISCSPT